MFIDLNHNYIVKNTITEKFSESLHKKLLPRLDAKYGASLLGIQMYEDYISDAFYIKGEWYYPLTLILATGPVTEWVKWRMKSGSFKDGIPYAYVGEGLLDINIASEVPSEFEDKLLMRSVCSASDTVKVNVETTSADPMVLSGRYSQTFVDEMARQLTARISEAMAVSGLETSGISLSAVFAPNTYMEHTSENVTYRRLLISDGASAPRDFWVKWTREDGAMAYTVSDHVSAENIVFDIGEDVPQKYREKEYRFLLASGGDKYHNAMGRKNITEWRELIKRAVRRGELVKTETYECANTDDVTAKLAAVLGKEPVYESSPVAPEASETAEFAHAMEMAREIAEGGASDLAEEEPAVITFDAPNTQPEQSCVTEIAFAREEAEEQAEAAEAAVSTAGSIFDTVYKTEDMPSESFDDIDDEEALEEEDTADLMRIDGIGEEEMEKRNIYEAPKAVSQDELEAKIRAEIEAKMRLEYETRARMEAEAEAVKLRQAAEELRRQNEQLLKEAQAERDRLLKEAQTRRADEARMRAELEEQIRREAKDRERLAEAAKIALDAARRDEEEKAREKTAAEDAARREAERAAAEAKAQKQKETEALAGHVKNKNYTYTSKSVRLLFRRMVDPNITARIYEIIKTTLEYYGKDKMYMRIKATIPDNTTVILEFVEIPMEEMSLLSNIIKVLGNSGLGIAKAVVE